MASVDSPALLILDLPQSSLAGIDLLSFTTTPRFKGVKELPEGYHFAFVGTSTAFSERHGVWFYVRGGETGTSHALIVTKWDTTEECLVIETDEAEVLRWRANLGSVWREGLTPYRQATKESADAEASVSSSDWPALTSALNPSLLSRVTGRESEDWRLGSASSSKQDLEDIPGVTIEDLDLRATEELQFLPINLKQTWREGATGRERTDAAQDRSWALENLVDEHCTKATDIIGELQFCFLMVLTINNFSCLEQWKRILSLLLTCKSAVASKPDFFVSFIATLRRQLQHCKDAEGGLIDLTDENGSLLKVLLVRFRKGLEGLTGIETQDVADELDDLEDYLRQEHGWQWGGVFAKTGILDLEDGEQVQMETTAFDAEDETGEFAPQIVDLTPEQAELLGLQGPTSDLTTRLSRTSVREEVLTNSESEDGDRDATAEDSDESELAGDVEDMDARY